MEQKQYRVVPYSDHIVVEANGEPVKWYYDKDFAGKAGAIKKGNEYIRNMKNLQRED